MNKKNALIIVLVCGTVWGCVEAGLGLIPEYPFSSVLPTLIGFMILALARTYLPQPGSSTGIGAIAMLYRAMTANGWPCHLWAVLLIGISFDVVATLVGKRSETETWRSITGPISAYLAYASFALTMTYIMIHIPPMAHCAHWWVVLGLPKVLDYVAISGSLAAIGASVFVPLGYKFGKSLMGFSDVRLKPAFIGAMVLTLLLWLIGIVF